MAQEEAAGDQQLLSAGVNDRNVEEFLGLIEQRIDDLIQVLLHARYIHFLNYIAQLLISTLVQLFSTNSNFQDADLK